MTLKINSNQTEKTKLTEIKPGDCFEYEHQFYQVIQENEHVMQQTDGHLFVYCFDVAQITRLILTAAVIPVTLTMEIK